MINLFIITLLLATKIVFAGPAIITTTEDPKDYYEDAELSSGPVAQLINENDSQADTEILRSLLDLIGIISGVPVDYGYNESSTGEGLTSVPGCPKSVDGFPWVYFGTPESAMCYLAGEKGPCDFHQVMFIEEDSPFGFCNCKCFEGMKREGDKELYCEEKPDDLVFPRKLEFAFLPKEKKCFELFTQGPCKDDEWLVADPSSLDFSTKCEARTCPPGQYPDRNITSEIQESSEVDCRASFAKVAFTGGITKSDCEGKNMKYSEILRKCYEDKTSKFLF